MATRRPIGAITQYDPGIYQDSQGGFFSGTSMDDAQYLGDDPTQFNLPKMSNPDPKTPDGPVEEAPPITVRPNETGQAVPWLPGGTPSIPPTAHPIDPTTLSPQTFGGSIDFTNTSPVPSTPEGTYPPGSYQDGSPNFFKAFFQSKGVTPFPTSINYWVKEWPNLVARGKQLGDPNYAMNRLLAADEFKTGGGGTPSPSGPTTFQNNVYYHPSDVPGIYQYDPGVFTDGTHYFVADGKGGGYYVGDQPPGSGDGTNIDGGGRTNKIPSPTTTPTPTTTTTTGGTPYLPTGYAPPGGPIDPGLNQVGQDPFSQLITSALAGMLNNGHTAYGTEVQDALRKLLGANGMPDAVTQKLVAARDAEANAFTSQMGDARSALAERGLVSQPGVGQGAEGTAIDRISQGLAPAYAQSVADITSHALDTANTDVISALQMATGLSESDANNVLTAASLGTTRQSALANIALQTLQQNMNWQEFLANYGLQQDQVKAMIDQGNLAGLTQLLQLFLGTVNTSVGGYL